MMEEKYHQDWIAEDLPRINWIIQNMLEIQDKETFFQQLMGEIEITIDQLKTSPYHASKKLRYGQLAKKGYYSCKFFSSPLLRYTKRAAPDMRIIYRYSEDKAYIYLKAVGFRHEPPSIYKEGEAREDKF